jgi:hypothetical protein
MSSKETAPTTVTAVIIIGSSTAGLRPEKREMDKDKDIITAPAGPASQEPQHR